jgi:hypothetical protein
MQDLCRNSDRPEDPLDIGLEEQGDEPDLRVWAGRISLQSRQELIQTPIAGVRRRHEVIELLLLGGRPERPAPALDDLCQLFVAVLPFVDLFLRATPYIAVSISDSVPTRSGCSAASMAPS